MSRTFPVPRSAWATLAVVAAGLLPMTSDTPVAANEGIPACASLVRGPADPSGGSPLAPATVAAAAIDGPWERIPLPGGPTADDRHLVATGARTATLLWREAKRLFLASSEDGGRTWTDPRELVDPEQAARRLTVAGSGRTIHLLSDMRYRRSTDGGVTWTAPRSLATHAIHAALWTDGADRVVVAWWNHASLNARVSTDGGRHFGAAHVLAPWDGGDGCALAEPDAIGVVGAGRSIVVSSGQAATILVRSSDAGATWRDVVLPRYNGSIASDGSVLLASAGYRGQVRRSVDGGRTWGPRNDAAPQWIDLLTFTGGRWWALYSAGSQLKGQSSPAGGAWGDRTLVGYDSGLVSDLTTLDGHPVLLDGDVLAIRPD